jgi:hypothetical protein
MTHSSENLGTQFKKIIDRVTSYPLAERAIGPTGANSEIIGKMRGIENVSSLSFDSGERFLSSTQETLVRF